MKSIEIEIKAQKELFLLIILCLLTFSHWNIFNTNKGNNNSQSYNLTKHKVVFSQTENNVVAKFHDACLKHVLKSNPESIYTLTSREFEEFVAYLYKRNGFNVHITPPSKDGGKDIIARYDMPTGEKITYFIECKKYNPRKKVGVHVVRALAGVMQNEQVHIGVIASTAGFTAGAKNIIIEKNYNIELKDMNDITCMLS